MFRVGVLVAMPVALGVAMGALFRTAMRVAICSQVHRAGRDLAILVFRRLTCWCFDALRAHQAFAMAMEAMEELANQGQGAGQQGRGGAVRQYELARPPGEVPAMMVPAMMLNHNQALLLPDMELYENAGRIKRHEPDPEQVDRFIRKYEAGMPNERALMAWNTAMSFPKLWSAARIKMRDQARKRAHTKTKAENYKRRKQRARALVDGAVGDGGAGDAGDVGDDAAVQVGMLLL